jgi:hypothetical protein
MKVAVGRTGSSSTMAAADDLHALDPCVRRSAARSLGRFSRHRLLKRVEPWPSDSPGVINAWLVLVTTKPPNWRDPLLVWKDDPPTFGTPHEGFFYPDPLGFWTEVRKWVTTLVRSAEPEASMSDALSVAAVLHVGDRSERWQWALAALNPAVVLFLDEASCSLAGVVSDSVGLSIRDPHRPGVVYEGFWGRTATGLVVGKAPQHPAAHLLYAAADMESFLRAIPASRN